MFILLRLVLICVVIFASKPSSTNLEYQVKGKISSAQKLGLQYQLISLLNDSLQVNFTRTNINGEFSFNKLHPGKYRLYIAIDGFKRWTGGTFELSPDSVVKKFENIVLFPE